MTTLYIRKHWKDPWQWSMVLGAGVNAAGVIKEMRRQGYSVAAIHEPEKLIGENLDSAMTWADE